MAKPNKPAVNYDGNLYQFQTPREVGTDHFMFDLKGQTGGAYWPRLKIPSPKGVDPVININIADLAADSSASRALTEGAYTARFVAVATTGEESEPAEVEFGLSVEDVGKIAALVEHRQPVQGPIDLDARIKTLESTVKNAATAADLTKLREEVERMVGDIASLKTTTEGIAGIRSAQEAQARMLTEIKGLQANQAEGIEEKLGELSAKLTPPNPTVPPAPNANPAPHEPPTPTPSPRAHSPAHARVPATTAADNEKKKWLLPIILGVIIALLLGLAYFAWAKRDNGSPVINSGVNSRNEAALMAEVVKAMSDANSAKNETSAKNAEVERLHWQNYRLSTSSVPAVVLSGTNVRNDGVIIVGNGNSNVYNTRTENEPPCHLNVTLPRQAEVHAAPATCQPPPPQPQANTCASQAPSPPVSWYSFEPTVMPQYPNAGPECYRVGVNLGIVSWDRSRYCYRCPPAPPRRH